MIFESGDSVSGRMSAAQIRQWVTPFVMRHLIHCVEQGKRVIAKEELLQAGIHELSVEALVQTKRLAPLPDQADRYQITIET